MDKTILRKKYRLLRDKLSSRQILQKSDEIAACFIDVFYPLIKKPKAVMIYISTQSEVSTSEIIQYLLQKRIKVYVPCIDNGIIIPVLYTKSCSLVKGAFNIEEPKKKTKLPRTTNLDLIIAPGIAFDNKGNRIGFGKGFFDKFLATLDTTSIKLALAFETQLVKKISSAKHDMKMDYIITEKRLISCGVFK
ncbi:MAG: 5-formyltetrahydrofolate cyclo-ligase [bacterium]